MLDDACGRAPLRRRRATSAAGGRSRCCACRSSSRAEPVALLYLENQAAAGRLHPRPADGAGRAGRRRPRSRWRTAGCSSGSRRRSRSASAPRASLRFLADAGDALAESLDYEARLNRLARLAVDPLADWCVVDVLEEPGELRRVAAAHRDPAREAELLQHARAAGPAGPARATPAVAGAGRARPGLARPGRRPSPATATTPESIRRDRGPGQPQRHGAAAAGARPPAGHHDAGLGGSPSRRGPRQRWPLAQELARRAAVAVDNARLYREAQEAIRLRDEFLSIASHELNTPLATLRLMVEGLQTGLVTPSPELLATSLRHPLPPDPPAGRPGRRAAQRHPHQRRSACSSTSSAVDLAQLVERRGRPLRPRTWPGPRCTLTVRVEPHRDRPLGPQPPRADRDQPPVQRDEVRPRPPHRDRPADGATDTARLAVTDAGIGIPAEQIPKIFDRFSRGVSASHYGGLGLGLYIVSQIVQALGGTVTVRSQVGAGSTFTVELPLDSARGPAPTPPPTPTRGAMLK